jgi:hypothetical protein
MFDFFAMAGFCDGGCTPIITSKSFHSRPKPQQILHMKPTGVLISVIPKSHSTTPAVFRISAFNILFLPEIQNLEMFAINKTATFDKKYNYYCQCLHRPSVQSMRSVQHVATGIEWMPEQPGNSTHTCV